MTGMTSEQIREFVKAVCDSRDHREHILEKYVESYEIYDFGFDAGVGLALKLAEIIKSSLTFKKEEPNTVWDAFQVFLKQNHADEYYRENIQNLVRQHPIMKIKNQPPEKWVIQPFDWEHTKQGLEYWIDINKKWRDRLYQIESQKHRKRKRA